MHLVFYPNSSKSAHEIDLWSSIQSLKWHVRLIIIVWVHLRSTGISLNVLEVFKIEELGQRKIHVQGKFDVLTRILPSIVSHEISCHVNMSTKSFKPQKKYCVLNTKYQTTKYYKYQVISTIFNLFTRIKYHVYLNCINHISTTLQK